MGTPRVFSSQKKNVPGAMGRIFTGSANTLRIIIKLEVLLRIEPRFTDQHLKTFTLDHVQAPCRLWRYRPTGRFSHQLSAERHKALPKVQYLI